MSAEALPGSPSSPQADTYVVGDVARRLKRWSQVVIVADIAVIFVTVALYSIIRPEGVAPGSRSSIAAREDDEAIEKMSDAQEFNEMLRELGAMKDALVAPPPEKQDASAILSIPAQIEEERRAAEAEERAVQDVRGAISRREKALEITALHAALGSDGRNISITGLADIGSIFSLDLEFDVFRQGCDLLSLRKLSLRLLTAAAATLMVPEGVVFTRDVAKQGEGGVKRLRCSQRAVGEILEIEMHEPALPYGKEILILDLKARIGID